MILASIMLTKASRVKIREALLLHLPSVNLELTMNYLLVGDIFFGVLVKRLLALD